MKRWVLIGLAVVVAAAIVVVAIVFWPRDGAPTDASASSEPTSAPSVDPSPVPTPAATAAPGEVDSDGSELVLPFFSAEAAARQDPETPLVFESVATGTALRDLAVNALEFAENGLVQTGSPEVVSAVVTATDSASTPPSMTVLVCLDYTGVEVIGTDGTPVKSDEAAQRVPSILVLVQDGGRWLVSQRTFPDESTC